MSQTMTKRDLNRSLKRLFPVLPARQISHREGSDGLTISDSIEGAGVGGMDFIWWDTPTTCIIISVTANKDLVENDNGDVWNVTMKELLSVNITDHSGTRPAGIEGLTIDDFKVNLKEALDKTNRANHDPFAGIDTTYELLT